MDFTKEEADQIKRTIMTNGIHKALVTHGISSPPKVLTSEERKAKRKRNKIKRKSK